MKVSEVYEVIVWMCDALNMSRVILPDPILSMHTILDSLMCSDPEVEASIRKQDFQKQRLSEFMENEMRIEEYHKTELEPVEITEGYDAGWLSPDGCRPMATSTASTGARETCSTSTSLNGCWPRKRFR